MENPNWRQVLASILGISVLGLIGYFGGARTKSPSPAAEPPKTIQAIADPARVAEAPALPEKKEPKKLVLDIGGAVSKPGVYWLEDGCRLGDLVVLAGGLLPTADRDRINLALVLKDGVKVTIPYKPVPRGETSSDPPVVSEPEPAVSAPGDPPVAAEPKILNINLASAADLQGLPSIGQELASRIVKYREGVGGFKAIEEVKQVRGIGDKLFEKIRPYLTL